METVQRGKAARSMAKVPAYADGGVVQPFTIRGIMNRAKSLMEPAPAEDITAKYARQDAEFKAKNPTPVPAQPVEQKPDVVDKINARHKLLQGLKDGGPVKAGIIRGPGTGTSDSIKGTMPVGSFVMPKDSTDVMVSNGETNLPPEAVMKVGVAALMAMKAATHTPADEQAEDPAREKAETSEENETYLKNGGCVKKLADGGLLDEKKNNSFGDAAAASQSPSVTQIPTSGYSPAPAAERQIAPDLPAQSSYGDQIRNVGSAILGAPVEAVKTLVSAPGYGISAPAKVDPITQTAPAATAAPVPNQSAPQAAAAMAAPVTPVAPATPAAPSASSTSQVTRVGNSYSGGPNITGNVTIDNPRGGAISPQNQQAAQALSDKYTTEARQTAAAQMAAPTGPQVFIGKDTGGYGILDKNYQQARSMFMDVDSSKRGNETTAGYNARIASAKDSLASFQKERFAAPQADANRASADANAQRQSDNQRMGYGITAQNNKAVQQNAAARLGIDRTNSTLANQQTSQQIAASKQMQDLQNKLLTAKPEERAGLEENLRALQGKYEKAVPNRFTVVPGGTDDMGNKQASRVINNETGAFVDGAAPAKTSFETGKIYTDAKGNRATWNGTAFVPAK